MSERCSVCRLLESRVEDHRKELRRATRRSLGDAGLEARLETAKASQRLHRAQSYLRDHHSNKHRGERGSRA